MTTRKDRKRYSREFKIEAVRMANESGKPVAEVARELEISVHHLYRWQLEDKKKGQEAFPGYGKTSPQPNNQDELSRLRREVAILREERDILKKSLIFFARDEAKDFGLSGNTPKSSK